MAWCHILNDADPHYCVASCCCTGTAGIDGVGVFFLILPLTLEFFFKFAPLIDRIQYLMVFIYINLLLMRLIFLLCFMSVLSFLFFWSLFLKLFIFFAYIPVGCLPFHGFVLVLYMLCLLILCLVLTLKSSVL